MPVFAYSQVGSIGLPVRRRNNNSISGEIYLKARMQTGNIDSNLKNNDCF
jgi:hypothetical protein